MKITMASDVICPWCFIGKLRLQKAIDHLNITNRVELTYRPHILYPDIPLEGRDIKKSSSLRHVKQELESGATELGISLNLRGIKRIPQTRPIHLALMNLDHQAAWQMKEHLFHAYFVEGQDLTDPEVLQGLFEKEGYIYAPEKGNELGEMLSDNRSFGISAVPAFILNEDIIITGAQPVERWISYLNKTLVKSSEILG